MSEALPSKRETGPPDPALVRAKLRALVRRRIGEEPVSEADARLAAGCAAARGGGGTWILLEHEPVDGLGPALLALDALGSWSRGVLVVPGGPDAELVSLRLAAFAEPPALLPAEAPSSTEPRRLPLDEAVERAGASDPLDLEALLAPLDPRDAEAVDALLAEIHRRHPDVAVEPSHGDIVLSLDGLEVARIETSPEGATFEVGVGIHDQDARRQVVGWRVVEAASRDADLADLAHVLETVARHRVGRAPHPLRRLQPSRRLRARVMGAPALAGLPEHTVLAPVDDPRPAAGMRRDRPAVAVGEREVVVCSTGIDLGLVPTAAHAWLRASRPGGFRRLVVVVPERDVHPATRRLLARVRPEAGPSLAPVAAGWDA